MQSWNVIWIAWSETLQNIMDHAIRIIFLDSIVQLWIAWSKNHQIQIRIKLSETFIENIKKKEKWTFMAQLRMAWSKYNKTQIGSSYLDKLQKIKIKKRKGTKVTTFLEKNMEGDLRDNSRTITRKGKTKKLIEVWGGKEGGNRRCLWCRRKE